MRRFLLLLLWIPFVVWADFDEVFSENDDPTISHHVNVITGQLNLSFQDALIGGSAPISISRAYSSSGALERGKDRLPKKLGSARGGWMFQGGWALLAHTNLLIETSFQPYLHKVYASEPNGTITKYEYAYYSKEQKETVVFKANTSRCPSYGRLTGRNHPQNNLLEISLLENKITLTLANGGVRIYSGPRLFTKNGHTCGLEYYLLMHERLPSGHHLRYHYNGSDLARIESTNPQGTKIYAFVDIACSGKRHESTQLKVTTSDGVTISYRAAPHKEHEYLREVKSSTGLHEFFHFVPGREGVGARVGAVDMGGKERFQVKYYVSKNSDDVYNDKVTKIIAPTGPHDSPVPIGNFYYTHMHTDMRGSNGLLTRFHHWDYKLYLIEYFGEKDVLRASQKFYWQGNQLICKAMLDASNVPLFAKTFTYDAEGNVVKEALWGSFTGNETTALKIDEKGHASGAESYAKTYSYYKNGLLKSESEEEGPTYQYCYKQGTDLCTSKLTRDQSGKIVARAFSFYDDDHLLIREFEDDGTSEEADNKRGVTQSLEKSYERDTLTGLATEISESYGNKLLKKTKLTYQNCRIHTEEIFDANDHSCYTLTTTYDECGRIKSKTTPLGLVNTYLYNSSGQLEESKEVGSYRKRFAYDQAGRLTTCSESDTGKVTKTCYDENSRVTARQDYRGHQTKYEYDQFGNQKALLLPDSSQAHFEYDIQGNLVVAHTPGGEKVQTRYNIFRNPTQIIQADGTLVRHFYNKNGTLAKTYYQDGTYTNYNYDLFQRVTAKRIYSKSHDLLSEETWDYNAFQMISHCNTRGLITRFIYDGAGRKIAEEALDRRTTFEYDALGFLETTDNGVVKTIQKHNIEGDIIKQWEQDCTGHIENEMVFLYDDEKRKEKLLRTTSQGVAIDTLTYKNGKIAAHTDPEGSVTQFIHDDFFLNEHGQQVLQKKVIDPLGNITIDTHDIGERLIFREKRNPSNEIVFQEEYIYNSSGECVKRISYIYENSKKTRESTIEWKYDPMGRTLEERENGKKVTRFGYDSRGNLTEKMLPDGVTLTYSYDGADRLTALQSSDGTIHYSYSYGQGPEPVQVTDHLSGHSITRQYNLFGELCSEKDERGNHHWSYDTIGRCISHTLTDGSAIDYLTKGAHIQSVLRKTKWGDVSYEHQYLSFDCNGHVTEEKLMYRLGTAKTRYDLLERPCRYDAPYLQQEMSYGPSGLVKETSSSLFGKKIYSYDALNQLQKEGDKSYYFDSLGNPCNCEVNDLNQITSTPECRYLYDENGNLVEKISPAGATKYTFDALGRLTAIATPSKQVTYHYDGFSRLYSKETGSARLYYTYDKDHEIGTQDERGYIIDLKILGLGLQGDIGSAVAIEHRGYIYAPLHDFKGNIIGLLYSNGSLYEKYDMDAFGGGQPEIQYNPWRFSSKRSEEGLVFFGLRFYDPSLGRWLTPDPAGYVEGTNLYVYVQNNPLNRLDLFGLYSHEHFKPIEIHVPKPMLPTVAGLSTILGQGSVNGVAVDFVLSCGHWHKLQFTPQEIQTNKVNIMDHLHELMPQQGAYFGLVTVGNGVNTSMSGCHEMTETVSQTIGGTLVVSLYNPTNGLPQDIMRTLRERNSVETKSVCLTRQFMAAIGEKMYNINQQALWLCIPHSENGVITKRAIEGMSEADQAIFKKILHVFAVAPAEPIPISQGASVTNIYSTKDYVTGFGPFGYAKQYMSNPDYKINVLPCTSSRAQRTLWIADHGFLMPTYKDAWEKRIDTLKKNGMKFYGDLTHAQTR